MNKKNKESVWIMSIVLLIIFLISVSVPLLSKYDYKMQDAELKYAPISKEHIFGNDYLGRDMFIRICWAIKNTIIISLYSIFVSLCIGLLYGTITGYIGKNGEKIMVAIMNVIESIPEFLLAILLMVVFNNIGEKENFGSLMGIFATITIISWVPIARMIANQTKKILDNDFVTYSKLKGGKYRHILFFHIIPNIKRLIIMIIIQKISTAIFLESFLSFIGIGIQPPMPSLGKMINEGIKTARLYPHLLIIPATCLVVIILLFNGIGEILSENNGDRDGNIN